MRRPVYFFKSFVFIAAAFALLFLSDCSTKNLPSTNVPPTRENKKIVKFLEQYKNAMEKRSIDAIMDLVAKDFSDNMGSEDPAKHLNYLTLKERLETDLELVHDLRLSLFVQHIEKIESGKYEVVFFFNKQTLVSVPAGKKWMSVREVVRMVIRQRRDRKSPYQYEILQGI
jgi:hypothetical protein